MVAALALSFRNRKNIFFRSELVGLGRIESKRELQSRESRVEGRGPNHEGASTRTKDEDEHDSFRRSRGGCFNAGRSVALPILLSFFIIRFYSAPPGGSVMGHQGRSRQASRSGRFGASGMGNLCSIRPEASLPNPSISLLFPSKHIVQKGETSILPGKI